MEFLAIAIASCVLAQTAEEPDRHTPRAVPARKTAPALEIDDTAPGTPSDSVPLEEGTPAETAAPAAEAPEEPAASSPSATGAADESGAPANLQAIEERPPQRLRPPELLAEALEPPAEGALPGTPMSLQTALSRAGERQQQLRIAQTYWRLAAAQAEYRWAIDTAAQIHPWTEPQADDPAVRSLRAAAQAAISEAQLAAIHAQQELADAILKRPEENLPLASDRPHVGEYRTLFDRIFSGRVAPARLQLINRTLPLRRKAIDDYAEAIVTSQDAVQAAGEAFQNSAQALPALVSSLESLRHARRAFLADVRDYNLDIAEYAFNTAPMGANNDLLVSMLIRTPPRASNPSPRAASTNPDSRVVRSTFETPANEPTPAKEPTPARRQMAQYLPDEPLATGEEVGPFENLLDVGDAPVRVQKLAGLLHWDRNLPSDSTQTITLAECLRGVAPGGRLAAIHAYWQAREAAARYQALQEQLEHFNALPAVAIAQREEPGMAEAGLRLQAARRAAQAAVLDAQVALLAAQLELTQAAGRPLESAWLLPITAPHAGRYKTTDSAGQNSARAKHWAEMMRIEFDKLQDRAEAVIQADAHRAKQVNGLRDRQPGKAPASEASSGTTELDSVLSATESQNEQTLAFLRDLTGYNMAIARYVLETLGESLPSDELARKLTLDRSTRRDQ